MRSGGPCSVSPRAGQGPGWTPAPVCRPGPAQTQEPVCVFLGTRGWGGGPLRWTSHSKRQALGKKNQMPARIQRWKVGRSWRLPGVPSGQCGLGLPPAQNKKENLDSPVSLEGRPVSLSPNHPPSSHRCRPWQSTPHKPRFCTGQVSSAPSQPPVEVWGQDWHMLSRHQSSLLPSLLGRALGSPPWAFQAGRTGLLSTRMRQWPGSPGCRA